MTFSSDLHKQRAHTLVVGGGPSGLAAAIAIRSLGHDVTLVDHRQPPLDKPCGEGIMPRGVDALRALGVVIPAAESAPFGGIDFHDVHDVRGGQIVARGRFPSGAGCGVRRTVLQECLVRRAEHLGVRLLWGETVREIDPAGVVLASGKLQADWIIAADGGTSRVRRQLGLDGPARHARIGIRRHYAIQPWTDTVQVHIGAGVEACVTPVGSETVCIAAMIDDNHTSFDQALARLPTLRQRLEVAPPASETRGAASVFTRALRVVSGNVALIGDAAASVDAIAGLGVTMGLRQALVVARSLKDGSLESYERAFPGLIRTAHAMTSFMLLLKRRRWLKRIVLQSMASRPWIANQLLRLHGGEALPPVNGQPEAFPVEIR